MTPTHAAGEPTLLHDLVMDRLANLWAARQLFRKTAHRAEWTVARWECEVELRALIRLARQARRQAKEQAAADATWRTVMLTRPEQGDPITAAKSYHDWQAAAPDVDKVWSEAELAYAAGR